MHPKTPITVIVLTYQEAENLPYALENVMDWAAKILVLDSGSKDGTLEIAKSMGAQVYHRDFDNYANQRNHALTQLPIPTDWVLFLDADEYLSPELKAEISKGFQENTIAGFDGYYLKRRFYFMGKWIKYGGYYPTWILRLFKKDKAVYEREVNEHIHLIGNAGYLSNDFVDHNRKGIHFWLEKHNRYATIEAQQFDKKHDNIASFWGSQAERKQWIRQNIWNKILPPLLRPFLYFFYRYFLRLGFLDGKRGFIFHFLHGLVYPFLIDVKYVERKYLK
jgi:glycosyltransferase involved in cell wall biosynthesis